MALLDIPTEPMFGAKKCPCGSHLKWERWSNAVQIDDGDDVGAKDA